MLMATPVAAFLQFAALIFLPFDNRVVISKEQGNDPDYENIEAHGRSLSFFGLVGLQFIPKNRVFGLNVLQLIIQWLVGMVIADGVAGQEGKYD